MGELDGGTLRAGLVLKSDQVAEHYVLLGGEQPIRVQVGGRFRRSDKCKMGRRGEREMGVSEVVFVRISGVGFRIPVYSFHFFGGFRCRVPWFVFRVLGSESRFQVPGSWLRLSVSERPMRAGVRRRV